ncbi:tail fiber domain-containing protein [Dyadobacter sp. 676]|uniref:Tail fiber domain-containing protein n=1 Tax=Dyadobacter sp. 676 TaxID=3088362 RepID=A0AAU8FLJ5_9BACT
MKTARLPAAFFVLASVTVSQISYAQVKIGLNPTVITPGANLDVEGVSNRHMVVMQSGRVGIGTTAPGYTTTIRAIAAENHALANGVILRLDPAGGPDIEENASILLNARAAWGYEIGSPRKRTYIRGNEGTDICLQVKDNSSALLANAFVLSGGGASGTGAGYVGLNTSLPEARLDVRGGSAKFLASVNPQTGATWNGTSNSNGTQIVTDIATGDAYVGIQRSGRGACLLLTKTASANSGDAFLQFTVNNAGVGSITYDGTGVSFNQNSDQRLKENIRATKFGLETLNKVKVYDYNFKSDTKKALSTGVLAQELHKVYPQAVKVGGDSTQTNPWQVDYSKLVPMLVQSIQDLNQAMLEQREEFNKKSGIAGER